jgi:enoyl-CoA hydratase/long-chain 3-hydroxyacyl-CoA dehydrogenase
LPVHTGKVLRPDKAKKAGLVDHLVQPIGPGLTDPVTGTHRYLEQVAVQTCAQLASGKLKVNKDKPFLKQVCTFRGGGIRSGGWDGGVGRLMGERRFNSFSTPRVSASIHSPQISNFLLTNRPLLDSVLMRKATEGVMKQTQGNYPAPLKIISVLRTGLLDGEQQGYEAETQVFWRVFMEVDC